MQIPVGREQIRSMKEMCAAKASITDIRTVMHRRREESCHVSIVHAIEQKNPEEVGQKCVMGEDVANLTLADGSPSMGSTSPMHRPS
jgi:hypothetical protein